MTRIQRMEDLRPGDLFLGPIGGGAGVGVRLGQIIVDGGWKVGPLDVRHIGVVVEAVRKYEGPTTLDRTTGEYMPATVPELRQDTVALTYYPSGVITAPKLAQAMPGGAEIIDMTYEKHWTPKCAYARIPEDYPGQAEDAAAIARLMVEVGVGYSWASYPALALYSRGYKAPRLTEWIGRRRSANPNHGYVSRKTGVRLVPSLPIEAICSVFADQAWSLAGKRVMEGTAPQAVTPSQFGQRLLFDMDDVIWSWPSRSPLGGGGERDFLFGV